MIRGEENNVSCDSLPKRKNHSSLVGFPLEKTHITCFQIEVIAAGVVEFHDHHHLRNGNICSRNFPYSHRPSRKSSDWGQPGWLLLHSGFYPIHAVIKGLS